MKIVAVLFSHSYSPFPKKFYTMTKPVRTVPLKKYSILCFERKQKFMKKLKNLKEPLE